MDRTALEELGVTYDVKDSRGSQLNSKVTGFIDENGDGVFQSDEATSEDVILLGGNSIAALANANFPVPNPALELVTSLVLGRHTLITFLDALQSVTLSDVQAKPVVTVMNHRQAEISSRYIHEALCILRGEDPERNTYGPDGESGESHRSRSLVRA